MSYWPWILVTLLGAASVLLAAAARGQAPAAQRATQRRFDDLLRAGMGGDRWILAAIERMAERPALGLVSAVDQAEFELLVRRAGWADGWQGTASKAALWLAPVVMALAAVGVAYVLDKPTNQSLTLVFIGFTLGYLAPRRLLRLVAGRRQEAIARQMPLGVHLMRMLFDAGLSAEQALRVMHVEGRVILPHLATELGIALSRIGAGMDRAEALEEMAAPLDVPELTDTVAILKQITRTGGSVRDTLMKFATLMEERQEAALRERVGKLSAKMTVVMVAFLFPALMIFLAGPGFLALGKALADTAS